MTDSANIVRGLQTFNIYPLRSKAATALIATSKVLPATLTQIGLYASVFACANALRRPLDQEESFLIVEHGPPATFFDEAKDPRTKEFLSQIL